jgi:manganese/zinc/iron transport system permease protein
MINPYWDTSFFSFFYTLFQRLLTFSFLPLASDERQMIVLGLISISCGLIGSFAVVKKMTMLANSFSHTVIIGIFFAALFASGSFQGKILSLPFSSLILASILTACITSGLTLLCKRLFALNQDASIGLVFITLFAIGLLLFLVYFKHSQISYEIVMGNADCVMQRDLKYAFYLLLLNLLGVCCFFAKWEMIALDSQYAKLKNIAVGFYEILYSLFLAITVLISFISLGAVLVLVFLTGPVLIARQFCHDLKKIVILSPLIGLVFSVLGVAVSRHFLSKYFFSLSTSGIISTMIFISYICILLIKNRRTQMQRKIT